MTIQVQIRHLGGGDVSLDDCARFSSPMGEAIEASQILNEAYVLEVSSPGISNQLKSDRDFQTFRGFPVEVIFRSDNDSEHSKNGLLLQRSNEHVEINIKGRIKRICRGAVISVQLTNPTD